MVLAAVDLEKDDQVENQPRKNSESVEGSSPALLTQVCLISVQRN